jgi:hypothetical protein
MIMLLVPTGQKLPRANQIHLRYPLIEEDPRVASNLSNSDWKTKGSVAGYLHDRQRRLKWELK